MPYVEVKFIFSTGKHKQNADHTYLWYQKHQNNCQILLWLAFFGHPDPSVYVCIIKTPLSETVFIFI